MNDYTVLENLFKDEQDEIHFDLFKESNVIKINNNNGDNIDLTKTTAAQTEVALSYHNVRGLYFLAVVFVTNITTLIMEFLLILNH